MKKQLFHTPYAGSDVGYVLVLVRSGGRVIVIQKNRPAWQAGKLNYPGGKIEAGETPAQAAVRELREETGVEIAESTLRPVVLMTREGDFEIFVFATEVVDMPLVKSLTDEHASMLPVDELGSTACLDSLSWLYGLAFNGNPKFAHVEFERL